MILARPPGRARTFVLNAVEQVGPAQLAAALVVQLHPATASIPLDVLVHGFDDDFITFEQFVGAGEGVRSGLRGDDAAGGELVDDEFYEADLVGGLGCGR